MYLPLIILFLYFSIFHIKSEYLFHKNDILFTFIVDTEHSIKLRVFVPFFYSENAFSDKLRCQEGKTADFIVQFPPLTIRYFTFYKYLMVPGTFYFMTRTTGSVPDSRTRIRPESPRASATLLTASCTAESFCAAFLSVTRTFSSTCG